MVGVGSSNLLRPKKIVLFPVYYIPQEIIIGAKFLLPYPEKERQDHFSENFMKIG